MKIKMLSVLLMVSAIFSAPRAEAAAVVVTAAVTIVSVAPCMALRGRASLMCKDINDNLNDEAVAQELSKDNSEELKAKDTSPKPSQEQELNQNLQQ